MLKLNASRNRDFSKPVINETYVVQQGNEDC